MSNIRTILDKLIDKYTVALTSRESVTSFDERLVNTFKLQNDLEQELINYFRGLIDEEVEAVCSDCGHTNYVDYRSQILQELDRN